MNTPLELSKTHYYYSPFIFNPINFGYLTKTHKDFVKFSRILPKRQQISVKGSNEQSGEEKTPETKRKSFLTLEEAGLVEISGLSTHEKFLCRLTISSLNLLRVISEQEECKMEELNAGKVCDWFLKDKLKREQSIDSAVLQWDDSDLPF